MAKVKINREYIFKAYVTEVSSEFPESEHFGEFFTKSETHYYCEKDVLDHVKANAESIEQDGWKYGIYKVSTVEDSKIADMLVETITVKNGKIYLR